MAVELSMELRVQTDKRKSLIERAETVLKMIECCNERELCCGCPFENEPECHPLTTAKEIIVEMMDELPEWIRPDDVLPEVFQRVLVCRIKDPSEGPIVEQGYRDVGDWWKVYGARIRHIIAWMPMPESTKEE